MNTWMIWEFLFFYSPIKPKIFLLGKADAFHKIIHSIKLLVSYWKRIYFDGDIFVILSMYAFGGLMLGEQIKQNQKEGKILSFAFPLSQIPVPFNQRSFHLPYYLGDERNSCIKESYNDLWYCCELPNPVFGNPCYQLQHCSALKIYF